MISIMQIKQRENLWKEIQRKNSTIPMKRYDDREQCYFRRCSRRNLKNGFGKKVNLTFMANVKRSKV